MNQVRWLEQVLSEEKERLAAARQTIQKNPDSYSAKVALQSSEIRLAELKSRLRTERESCGAGRPTSR